MLVVFAAVATQRYYTQKTTAKSLASGGLASSLYFHPGHTWVNFQPTGFAKIGIDRFLREFLGKFEEVILPSAGRFIRQGDHLFTVVRGDKQLHIASPIDGVVSEANLSPDGSKEYSGDYLLVMRPTKIVPNLRVMTNYVESEGWLALEYEKLRDFVACFMNPFKGMGVTMADGGHFNEQFSSVLPKLDKQTLKFFNKEFLHC
jgi:hypothetical protein